MSGINVASKSVTVEWFEKGETKGKEESCAVSYLVWVSSFDNVGDSWIQLHRDLSTSGDIFGCLLEFRTLNSLLNQKEIWTTQNVV